MTARDGDSLDAFLTQLARHAPQLLKGAQAQICGKIDEVQHGGAGSLLIRHRGFIHKALLPKAEACFVAERYGAPQRPDKCAGDAPYLLLNA